MHSYRTIDRAATATIVVARSEFIATVAPAASHEAAQEIVAAQRAAHPKARHVVNAVVLDPERQTVYSSDDGEPSGTAGRPVLNALESAELTFIVATVVRYFGGTLLGAGKLTRTYRKAAAAAVEVAKVITMEPRILCSMIANYPTYARISQQADRFGWQIEQAQYGESVTFTLAVPPDDVQIVRDLTEALGLSECDVSPNPRYVASQ